MLLPAFPVEGGPPLALARGVADAALLSAFGALLFRAVLAPPVLARMGIDAAAADARLRRVAWFSLVTAALAAGGWLALQAVNMGGTLEAMPPVLRETLFGHVMLLRLGLLGLAALALSRRWIGSAAAFAGAAVVTQAALGHAASMVEGPSWLLLSEILHLLAAGAWLGGLPPLLILVATAAPGVAAFASRRFAPLGTACVLVLAGTALFQGSVLIGGLPGWIGTGYGLVALLKLALFVALLGFAARNRFRLTPALTGSVAAAKGGLIRSVAGEIGVGLLVVLAAGLLTSLPPAMHDQPVWPFAWRLSLDAVSEDAGFRREVVLAGIALAGAAGLLLAALLVRYRARWAVAAIAVAVAWFAAPHLSLLLVDAYPTYYWRSPTGFASASIMQGAALFPTHCAACHGAEGRGDGPAAKGLAVPPADLTAAHLWMHADGELFWWISHGIEAPDGRPAMPGFAGALSEDERWALIDWVRAHNAGLARAATGAWPLPVHAPGLEAECAGGRTVTLGDLRDQVVRLVFGTVPPAPGVLTVLVTADPKARPSADVCVAGDETVPRAYAVVTGIAPEDLPGTQALVDGQGWLRAVQQPDAAPGWDDPHALAAAVQDIESHPLAATSSMMGMDPNMRM